AVAEAVAVAVHAGAAVGPVIRVRGVAVEAVGGGVAVGLDRAAHRHVVDVEVVGGDRRVAAEAQLEAGLEGGGVGEGARAALPDVQVGAAALPHVDRVPVGAVEVLDVQVVAGVGRAGPAVHAQVRPEHHVAGRGV